MPSPDRPAPHAAGGDFTLFCIGQAGRLQYEALLLVASLRAHAPGFTGRVVVAEPQPGPLWEADPRMDDRGVREALEEMGAEILPFESRHFGAAYPNGNKIEALLALPEGEPFLFLDSDTLVLDELAQVPFDFDRPGASLKREGTWPEIELYGPGYSAIWKSLYDRFGLDFESSLDLGQPDEFWRRYLYFNAGYFFYRCPRVFGQRFLDMALAIRDDPPEQLLGQALYPWLDQIALPLVIHALGGGRDVLPEGLMDGRVTCHYRLLPLLYALESAGTVAKLEHLAQDNQLKKLLKNHEAFKRVIYQGKGEKARRLFDRDEGPLRSVQIRKRLKRHNLWLR